MVEKWLVRTASNLLLGPFLREELKDMIRTSKLLPQDEVCESQGYWIFIHEKEEVRKWLDVEVPDPPPGARGLGEEEKTETRTDTGAYDPTRKIEMTPSSGNIVLPGTAIAVNTAPSDQNLNAQGISLMDRRQQGMERGLEKAAFLRGLMVLLLIALIFGLFLLVRLLRAPLS